MIDINYSINIMKQELENKYISPEILYAFKASIVALDKQTPKKTIERQFNDLDCGELYEEGFTYHCPNCDNEVGVTSLTFKEVFWKTNYCCDCGQKLDWGHEVEQCSCYKLGESTNSGMKCSNCGREL